MKDMRELAAEVNEGGFNWQQDAPALMEIGLRVADVVRFEGGTALAVNDALCAGAEKAGWGLDERGKWLLSMYGRLCFNHFELLKDTVEAGE